MRAQSACPHLPHQDLTMGAHSGDSKSAPLRMRQLSTMEAWQTLLIVLMVVTPVIE